MLLNRFPLVTVALLTLGSSIAFTQPNIVLAQSASPSPTVIPTKKPAPNLERPGGLPKNLDLTPKQLEQIREIRRKNPARERIQRNKEELYQVRQEFFKLLASNASRDQVNVQYRKINDIREKIANAEYQDDLDIREILTLQQRRKLVEYIERRNSTPPNPSREPR